MKEIQLLISFNGRKIKLQVLSSCCSKSCADRCFLYLLIFLCVSGLLPRARILYLENCTLQNDMKKNADDLLGKCI